MNINYNEIFKIFDNNLGPLSKQEQYLDFKEFFTKVPTPMRAQCEYFIRTDLGMKPIEHMSEILDGIYANNEDIEVFTIPSTVKKCANAAFRGSDLETLIIDSAFNGTIDMGILTSARNLNTVIITENAANNLKKIYAASPNPIAGQTNITFKIPQSLENRLGSDVDWDVDDNFGTYFQDNYDIQ